MTWFQLLALGVVTMTAVDLLKLLVPETRRILP
jgi:hypothetical protein